MLIIQRLLNYGWVLVTYMKEFFYVWILYIEGEEENFFSATKVAVLTFTVRHPPATARG